VNGRLFGPHRRLPINLKFALIFELFVLLFFFFLWSWGSIVFALGLLHEEGVGSFFN
jgi:hypothetical protein